MDPFPNSQRATLSDPTIEVSASRDHFDLSTQLVRKSPEIDRHIGFARYVLAIALDLHIGNLMGMDCHQGMGLPEVFPQSDGIAPIEACIIDHCLRMPKSVKNLLVHPVQRTAVRGQCIQNSLAGDHLFEFHPEPFP